MALQSSGAITISDIKAELGSTSNSLETLSLDAGFTAPHAMSDFYGYSAAEANLYFWNFNENDSGTTFIGNGGEAAQDPFSFSMWVRPSWAATDVNVMLFEINDGQGINDNRMIFLYDYGFNRFVWRYRSKSGNYHINWALNANSAAGSISKWHSSSKGPVNSDGFAHIAGTFDPSQSLAVNGLTVYWNGVPFSTTITQSNATLFDFPKTHLYINRSYTATADRDAEYDNVAFWFNRLLTSTEINTLYNNGVPQSVDAAGLAAGLGFEATFEDQGLTDQTGQWQLQQGAGNPGSY